MMNRNIRLLLLQITVSVLPVLVTLFWVHYYFHVSIFHFVPFYSDEMYYWHESLDFLKAGFQGGYYCFEEHPAPAAFSHFDTHGPVFPMFYGLIGKALGWHFYSGILFNFFFFSVAVFLYLRITRSDGKRLALTALALLTFWPAMIYLPTQMQESVHQGAAIILAGIFYLLLKTDKPAPPVNLLLGALLLVSFVSLLRPTWSFFYLPLLLLSGLNRSKKNLLIMLPLVCFLILGPFFLFLYWGAPYPFGFVYRLPEMISVSPFGAFRFFMEHFQLNLISLVQVREGHFLEALERWQMLFLFAAPFFIFIPNKKRDEARESGLAYRRDMVLQFFNVASILGIVVVLYELMNWQDYRIFAPYVLFTLLLYIALQRRGFVVSFLILSNMIFMPAFSASYKEVLSKSYLYDRAKIASFKREVEPVLSYRENKNAWCNTLLSYLTPWPFKTELTALPAGIGLSSIVNLKRVRFPLRSKYVLLDQKGEEALQSRARLVPLVSTEIGKIFVNLDAQCD